MDGRRRRLALAVLLGSLVLALSSVPAATDLGALGEIASAAFHLAAYAALTALLVRVLRTLAAAGLAVSLAALAEALQLLVPGRQASVADFALGAAGALAGAVVITRRCR